MTYFLLTFNKVATIEEMARHANLMGKRPKQYVHKIFTTNFTASYKRLMTGSMQFACPLGARDSTFLQH